MMYQIGKIVNTHGLKGEVKVKIETDFPERFDKGNKVFISLNGDYTPLIISQSRLHKGMQIVKFEGYESINQVEAWKTANLYIQDSQQSVLAEDEFYYHEIIGCDVYTLEEEWLGEVTNILTPGANDVWVVKKENGKELLIPYIDDVVKEINTEAKTIRIYLMEGLDDL